MAIYANEVKKLEKDGISQTVIRTGERKWPLMPYVPVAEDDVRKVRASLELVLGEFATAVEEARRGKSKLARAELVTGEAWMGAEAHVLGLVDGPAEVDGVMARLAGGEVRAYRQFDLAAAAGGTANGGAASAPMTAGAR